MRLIFALTFLLSTMAGQTVFGQGMMEDVHLIQSFFRDASITKNLYGEAGMGFDFYDNDVNSFGLGVKGGYAINSAIEMNAGIEFINIHVDLPDYIDASENESGISDLLLAGRYNLIAKKYLISAGGYLTLPIGSEDVGQGKLNFGGFTSLRYPIDNQIVITGNAGFGFLEDKSVKFENFKTVEKTEYDFSLNLAGGLIYSLQPSLALIGELEIVTASDYVLLSAGADYKLPSIGRARAALGLGLDDGAPDFQILGGFIYDFNVK